MPIRAFGPPPAAALAGGHRQQAIDVFFDGERLVELPGERHPSGAAHGSAADALGKSTFIDVSAIINAAIVFLITAAVVYFLLVLPMNKLAERRRRGREPEPEKKAEDILLLEEIRDLLRAQRQAGA